MRMFLRGAATLAAVVTVASLTRGATTQPRTGKAAETAGTVQASAAVQIPPGVTADVAVFDRQTGTFTEQVNESARFRSASVVKLLLTLDFLWDRGPDCTIPRPTAPGWSRCCAAATTTPRTTTGRRTAARRSSTG
jgi:D-alanyl-D-alanine carboxypeptidase